MLWIKVKPDLRPIEVVEVVEEPVKVKEVTRNQTAFAKFIKRFKKKTPTAQSEIKTETKDLSRYVSTPDIVKATGRSEENRSKRLSVHSLLSCFSCNSGNVKPPTTINPEIGKVRIKLPAPEKMPQIEVPVVILILNLDFLMIHV